MNNFLLTLDRQRPVITFHAKNNYETSKIELTISGDKILLEQFDNIIVKRYEQDFSVDFEYLGDKFYGEIDKGYLDYGHFNVYAQLKSESGVLSNTLSIEADFVSSDMLFIAKLLPVETEYTVSIINNSERGDVFNYDYNCSE